MGMEMELDFDKSYSIDLSPNTVLPSHRHCSNVAKGNTRGKPVRRDDILSLKEDFIELNFSQFRSSSCKSIPSRPVGLEGNLELKRGSMYQNSKEVRKMKKIGIVDRGANMEVSRSSDNSFSFRIVDSLCGSDEEGLKKRSSMISLDPNLSATSVSESCEEPCSSDTVDGICLNSSDIHKPAGAQRKDLAHLNFGSDEAVGPLSGDNGLERDMIRTFQKSFSAKLEMPHSPSSSESDYSFKLSSKARFSPIRKMFDPFKKSKSLRSPLGCVVESGGLKTPGTTNNSSKTSRKSLLSDFVSAEKLLELEPQYVGEENHQSVVGCSPVHLHGYLKLEYKHGVPFFKFSLKCPEEVFVAKTWKTNDAFNWVYTFHSIDGRKKSNASGWRWNNSDKDSSMVGQMQVSCYLCSELKGDRVVDNSVVTEFVLYDIAHARQSVGAQENGDPGLVKESSEDESHPVKLKLQQRQASDKGDFGSSNSYPWPSTELHPDLEIAAIVMQVPFEKRESLTYKSGNKVGDKVIPSLLNHSMIEPRKKDHQDSRSPEKVKVLVPTGNHGLPSAESRGPSPLLDRWRLGGGCDCGGWDMACPITVLGNPCIQFSEDQSLQKQPLELFVQGAKESTPTLTMTFVEEGEYAVDFHAQLSTLQAFSICVAILHGTQASTDARPERNKQLPQSNTLKVLIDDGVNFLIEAVTTEEKTKVTKMVKEIPSSYVLNPPFSPISRV